MKKYISAVVLALCLAAMLLPATVLAAAPPTEGSCGQGLTWKYEPDPDESGYDKGGTLTISGNGAMEDYDNNSKYAPWRSYGYSIKELVFDGQPTSIGNWAFSGCYALTSVTIPDSVTSIGVGAFGGCGALTSVTIPGGVTSIGDSAFSSCTSLSSVTFSEGLLTIGRGAFSGTPLKSISIPASVIRLGNHLGGNLFDGYQDLEEIIVAPGNKHYSSVNGALLDKDGGTLICCPAGKTSYDIPAGVVKIERSAFYGCSSLASVTIPDSVTSIGYFAFANCTSLKEAAIPALKDYSLSRTFQGCTALSNVTIAEGVTYLSETFSGCTSLASVSLPVSLKGIESNTFANCLRLKTVTYAGTETQWGAINIQPNNQELDGATLVCTGTGPTGPDEPDPPTDPDKPAPPTGPDEPSTPGALVPSVTNGGLGRRVTVAIEGGHWLTVQIRRAGSVAVTSVQAPGSAGGMVSLTFSAAAGSTAQLWETEEEMTFTNGVPNNRILKTVIRYL